METAAVPATGAVFSLTDTTQGLYRKLMDGISIRAFRGENIMLSIVTLDPHISGKPHHHPEEQWGVMLEGEAVRVQNGIEYKVKKGDFWYTPSNMLHSMINGPEKAVVLDIFSPPREVYATPGEGYGTKA